MFVSSEKVNRYYLGGHEKFVFRYGWLRKGFDAISADPDIFKSDRALVELGVGKNMVRAIRHWCLATGVILTEDQEKNRSVLKPGWLGNQLFGETGWDLYLEDVGTLWLLHWQLSSNLERCLIWHLLFSTYLEPEFSKRQLYAFLEKQLGFLGVKTTEAMINREIDCCIRTYLPVKTSKYQTKEESLECPLAELDLLRYSAEAGTYYFNIGTKPSLPKEIFGSTLFLFINGFIDNRRTISVDECIYRKGSPGQIFKMDENSVIEYLEWLEHQLNGMFRLEETAGYRQIFIGDSLAKDMYSIAETILRTYYEQ